MKLSNLSHQGSLLNARQAFRGILICLAASMCPPAHAVDGCKVLMCLAGNWKQIESCQPDVHQALHDVAKGRGWPSCSMSNSSASSSTNDVAQNPSSSAPTAQALAAAQAGSDVVTATEHQWASAPGNCPEQYLLQIDMTDGGPIYTCRCNGVINVWVAGKLWSRVWWAADGDTATEYSEEARARLGASIDPKFDADLAAYRATQGARTTVDPVAAE